jgi:PAS domain S-box-containing protein
MKKYYQLLRCLLLLGSVLLFIGDPFQASALDPNRSIYQYNCRTWTRQNGLPADGINAIAQTLDGYLWLGTAEGLVSFDGIEFKSHRLSHLQSQIITSLSSSKAGGLWIGMEHGAFAYCDGQNITYQGREAWGGVNLNLHSILETRDHAVWLGAETEVARLSKEHLFQTFSNYDTAALMQDSKGRVWLGTAHRGLFWWENGVLTRFPDHAVDGQEIHALAEDKDGQIWIGTDWGPLCYDSNFLRKDFPSPWYPTRALLVDREGTLWMGTTGAGLIKYQNGTTTSFRKQDGLADDYVSALAEDQEGNLWVGTRSGLSEFSNFRIPTFTKTEGVPAEIIADVSASRNGGLWLATGHGFTYFDGKGNSSTTLLGLTNEYVNRIFEAKNGDIYLINGYKDIEIFHSTNVLARYTNDDWPTAFGEDDTGVVVGVGKNLFRVGTNYFSPFPFAGGQNPELGWIFNIAPGRDGSLWLATDAGICRIKDGVFKLWSAKDGLPDDHAVWVCEDNQGVVWAGLDKGIARIKDGKVTTVNCDHGLFDNIIYSAIPDNHGRLWVDASRGFFSLDTRNFDDFANGKTDHVTCTDFTGLDGVKSSDRFQQQDAGCRTLDGRIWFPTAQGVVMIDPDRVKTQSVPPRIYVQSTRADGTELKPGEKTARPGKGDLEFQYVGLSYIASQRIHYRYMLQGYNKEWVDAGTRRSAFYTNLKPGQYRFLVQACNEDGFWSTAAASVDVELLPHFYQTAWFISLVVTAFIAALFAIYAWRLKAITHKQQQLQKTRDLLEVKVRERTSELRKEIEERKRAEEELRNSQALYHSLVEHLPQSVFRKDRDGRFLFVNERFCQGLRHSFEDIVGRTDADFFPPELTQAYRKDDLRVMETGQVLDQEEKHIGADGQELFVHVIKTPLRDAQGRIVGVQGVFSDITVRKQAEEARRESEERLRSHTENSPLAVVEWDADMIITRWTGAAEKIFGWSAEEAIGKPITELPGIYEEDLPLVQSVIQQLAGGASKHVVSSNRNRTRNGQIIHCEWYSSVLHDAGGKMMSVLSQVLDITERKQAEETVARERQLLRTLIDLLPDTFYVKDLDSRFLVVNEALAEQLGKDTPSQVIGLSDVDLFPAGLAAEFRTEEMKIFAGEPLINQENTMVSPDGQERTVSTTKLPFRDSQGRICGLVGIGRDITERKQAEVVLEKNRRQLAEVNEMLQVVIDTIPVRIFWKNRDLVYMGCNRLFAEDAGRKTPDEILGETDYNLSWREQAELYRKDDMEVMRSGNSKLGYEEPQTTPEGKQIWLRTSKVPLRDINNRIVGVLGTYEDITGRKRAEESLHYEQTLMTTMMENIPDAVYFKDTASRFLRTNRALSQKFGVSDPAQLVGKSDADFFSGDHAGKALADEQEIIRTGRPLLDVEEKETWLDGTVGWVLTSKLPLRDAAGRIIGTCGISRDITERKRTEEALQRSHEEFKNLFDDAPVGVHEVDTEGRLVRINNTELKMLGYSAGELLGQFVWKISAEEETSRRAALARLGGERPPEAFGLMLRRKDGSTFPALINDRILKGANAAIVGIRSAVQDDTARRQAEEAMRLSEERLLKVIMQTRCILSLGHVEGPADWRERALNPKSPFNWDFPVLNVEAAKKILPLEVAAGEQYQDAWFHSRHPADCSQMDWNSGNAFLNDLPFYRNEFRCTDKNGVGHWMQEFVTVRKLAENRWQVFGITTDISDLKRVETELRESQALYYSLVDQMPAAVFRKDANGRFVFVNSAFCRLKDMTPDQFLGKTASELELKDVALATKGASDHAKIMQSGNPIEDDEIYSSAGGQTRNYHVVKSPVLNSAGKIVGTQGILFDLTELKQATQRIADMLNFNQTVLRASPVGIVVYKASGRCVSANETIGQIIGGTHEEVLKQNFRQLESWKQSGILAAAEAALAAQAERDLETQIVTSFGRKAWFSCRFAPFYYEGEAHLLLIVTDTTERKRTEEALRWSETQLQVILESTADGIMAVDSKGKRVIKANRRFAELWRIPQSLIDAGDNRALLDFVRNQLSDPDAFLKKAQSLYGTDAVDMDTLAFKDGRIFERYGFPMIMDGVVTGRVWSFRDITGRKRQEKELSDKNTELERFTYTVSHDLKSPLVTVKTFLGYLEQDLAGPDKERVKQDVAYMHTAADKMGQLLDELLNLARVGRKMNPAERVKFKELAQEAVRLVAGRISTGGAEVQVADAAVVLEGDRSRLMEIWQNLVENACKFMGNQPRPRVEIGVEKRASETVFFVRDNGAGIDPRYHDKVFGLFEKLDPKGEGTGMGLALVRRIVEMYKGRIWVESPGLGQGANFLFTLPGAVIIDPEQSS